METAEHAPKIKKVMLRDIARALEGNLYQNPMTSLHWISVIDEDSLLITPVKEWQSNDDLIQVGVVRGNSEGWLVYVHAQHGRYQPEKLTPLLRIKFLGNASQVFEEARTVLAFFESPEFFKLTAQT